MSEMIELKEVQPGYWQQIKDAVALTIEDAQELAIMRLQDLAGEELFPAIDRAVAYAVDQVEAKADALTQGAVKEDALVGLVMPRVREILKAKMSGVVTGMARRPIEAVLDEGIRSLARLAVAARNRAFGKRWADVALTGVHWVQAKLEDLLDRDLDQDGGVGTIGGVDY